MALPHLKKVLEKGRSRTHQLTETQRIAESLLIYIFRYNDIHTQHQK